MPTGLAAATLPQEEAAGQARFSASAWRTKKGVHRMGDEQHVAPLDCCEPMSIITRLNQKGASTLERGRKNKVRISLRAIGRIRTPFVEATGTPIQSVFHS
jgi:hypothetical protein